MYCRQLFAEGGRGAVDALLGVAVHRSDVVYITRGLADVLLSLARERAPRSVTVGLTVTPAERLEVDDADRENGDPPGDDPAGDDRPAVDPGAPVFAHFYHPDAGSSVRAVFGMDLSSPRTQGRFVSHPDGDDRLRKTDDLHEVVFVGVPPWERLIAYDRSGTRLPVEVLDGAPPPESVE